MSYQPPGSENDPTRPGAGQPGQQWPPSSQPAGGYQPGEPTQQFQPAQDDAPVFAPAPAGSSGGGGRRKGLVIGIVAAVLAIGVAFAAIKVFNSVAGTSDVLSDEVPASSVAYVTAFLDPGASQKIALKNLANKFPALSGKDLPATINQQLDQAFSQQGLSFTKDIQPWLGTQIAIAVLPTSDGPVPALLADAKDPAKAKETLTKAESAPGFGGDLDWKTVPYKGVDIRAGFVSFQGVTSKQAQTAYAVTGSTVIVGQGVAAVQAVIDTDQGGSALADNEAFQATVDALPKSTLGMAFVDLKDIGGLITGSSSSGFTTPIPAPSQSSLTQSAALPQINTNPAQILQLFQGVGAALTAQDEGIGLDVAVVLNPDKLTPEQQRLLQGGDSENTTLDSLPKHAFGVVAFTGFDQLIETALQQVPSSPDFQRISQKLNLQAAIDSLTGDVSIEVAPSDTKGLPVTGAIVMGTDDEAGMETFLEKAALEAVGPSGKFTTEDHNGVTVHVAHAPDGSGGPQPAFAVANGVAIIGFSAQEVEAVLDAPDGENIGDDPVFSDATSQVPAGNSLLFANVEALLGQFHGQLQDSGGGIFSAIEPNLRPIKAIVVTGEVSDTTALAHLFLLIR
jgi:Protein of unknown function (DUF3352)